MYRYTIRTETDELSYGTDLGLDRLLTPAEWHELVSRAVGAVGPNELLIADYLMLRHGFILLDTVTARSLPAGRSVILNVDEAAFEPNWQVQPLPLYLMDPAAPLQVCHPDWAPWRQTFDLAGAMA